MIFIIIITIVIIIINIIIIIMIKQKENNERFTAAGWHSCQNLKNENFSSSFGRLLKKLHQKACHMSSTIINFFSIQPIKLLICGVVIVVAIMFNSLMSNERQ